MIHTNLIKSLAVINFSTTVKYECWYNGRLRPNGTILDLSPDKITIFPRYANEEKSLLMPDDHNDIFFAMRRAGSSFGIATEF